MHFNYKKWEAELDILHKEKSPCKIVANWYNKNIMS